ncbi:MAG: ATP-binding cassette domain-containing protein [Methanobacteriota archaeon]|nr:MAG: ATP-binding cassette domain-containing protein [Euryarchaeota archaeon]
MERPHRVRVHPVRTVRALPLPLLDRGPRLPDGPRDVRRAPARPAAGRGAPPPFYPDDGPRRPRDEQAPLAAPVPARLRPVSAGGVRVPEERPPLLEVKDVSRSYFEAGKEFKILERVRFDLAERDFVCIVGPSGSGKSTLLRIILGLDKPTTGEVRFEGQPLTPDNPRVAMVFQSFALFPWLTVEQNAELGLEARHDPLEARHAQARKFIEAVGLAGFENAYPRELSGGMKQRVGIARALAIEPVLLCMDEPFSSLDALTAQNLRDEILQLWSNPELPPKAVLIVTHSIEEAVYLADRVIVLSARPGRIVAELEIDLPRPRNRKEPEFFGWVDEIYSLIV